MILSTLFPETSLKRDRLEGGHMVGIPFEEEAEHVTNPLDFLIGEGCKLVC